MLCGTAALSQRVQTRSSPTRCSTLGLCLWCSWVFWASTDSISHTHLWQGLQGAQVTQPMAARDRTSTSLMPSGQISAAHQGVNKATPYILGLHGALGHDASCSQGRSSALGGLRCMGMRQPLDASLSWVALARHMAIALQGLPAWQWAVCFADISCHTRDGAQVSAAYMRLELASEITPNTDPGSAFMCVV